MNKDYPTYEEIVNSSKEYKYFENEKENLQNKKDLEIAKQELIRRINPTLNVLGPHIKLETTYLPSYINKVDPYKLVKEVRKELPNNYVIKYHHPPFYTANDPYGIFEIKVYNTNNFFHKILLYLNNIFVW